MSNRISLLLTTFLIGLLIDRISCLFTFDAVLDSNDNGVAHCHNRSALFNVTSALHNAAHPQTLNISNIWCVAKTKKGGYRQISGGAYWKISSKKQFTGIIEQRPQGLRYTLEISNANFSDLGEYRCDLYVDSKIQNYYASEFIYINMRPVFVFNSTSGYKLASDDRFTVIAPKTWSTKDETVSLDCPAVSFPPINETVWYKEDSTGKRVEFFSSLNQKVAHNRIIPSPNRTITIINLTSEDSGKYYCVVNNSIQLAGGTKVFYATLVHELVVKGHYLWVLPLIIIAVMAVLLFVIIYGCGIINRCRTYNVEKRERRHAKTTETFRTSSEAKSQEPMLNYNKNEIQK